MNNFFKINGGVGFKMFSPMHISLILFTIVGLILLVIFRNKLRNFKHKEKVRYVMAGILLLNMIIHYTSIALTGQFDIKADLPLHLCFITNFFMIYILLTGNRKLYKIVYFFTFIGPLPAMIWSDLASSFDRYIFYQFIISHHVMFLTSMYLLIVLKYKVEKKYIIDAFIIGNLYVGLMAVLNNIIGSNYVMLTDLPAEIKRIYPWTNVLPAISWLEMVGLASMMISYIPAYIMNKCSKNKATEVKEKVA